MAVAVQGGDEGGAGGSARRGAGPLWIGVVLLAAVAALAGFVDWARRSPFEAAYEDLRAASPGDPMVLAQEATDDRDPAKLLAAAQALPSPGLAAAVAGHLLDDEDADPRAVDEALGAWAALEPGSPLPALFLAERAIARGDASEEALGRLEAAASSPGAPRLHGDATIAAHLALQRRLGTRDAIGLVVHGSAHSGAVPAFRRAAFLLHAEAEMRAHAGDLDGALARAAAIRDLGERTAAAGRSTLDVLVGMAVADRGAESEVRYALFGGDAGRARRVLEGIRKRSFEQGEYRAGFDAIKGRLELALDLWGAEHSGDGLVVREARRAWMRLRAKVSGGVLFELYEHPAGEFAYLRALGRAAPVARDPRPVEALLERPEAWRFPGPGDATLPAPLREALAGAVRDAAGEEQDLVRFLAPLMARWGRRALEEIERLPEVRREDLVPHDLPCVVAAGAPDAAGRIRAALEGLMTIDDAPAVAAAAIALGDPALLPALREALDSPVSDPTTRLALRRAIRALEERERASPPAAPPAPEPAASAAPRPEGRSAPEAAPPPR